MGLGRGKTWASLRAWGGGEGKGPMGVGDAVPGPDTGAEGVAEVAEEAEVAEARARGISDWGSKCWSRSPEHHCRRCDWCLAQQAVLSTAMRRQRSVLTPYSADAHVVTKRVRTKRKGAKRGAAATTVAAKGKKKAAAVLGVKKAKGVAGKEKGTKRARKEVKKKEKMVGRPAEKDTSASPRHREIVAKATGRPNKEVAEPAPAAPKNRFWEILPPAKAKPAKAKPARTDPKPKQSGGGRGGGGKKESELLYEVKALVARKLSTAEPRVMKYLVEWEGFADPTWEHESAFMLSKNVYNEKYKAFLSAHGIEDEVVLSVARTKYAKLLDQV